MNNIHIELFSPEQKVGWFESTRHTELNSGESHTHGHPASRNSENSCPSRWFRRTHSFSVSAVARQRKRIRELWPDTVPSERTQLEVMQSSHLSKGTGTTEHPDSARLASSAEQ